MSLRSSSRILEASLDRDLEITPLVDKTLLLAERDMKVLVAADIHLGIEYELWLGGASIPSQTGKLLDELLAHLKRVEPDRLVLLGDVKHNVPRSSWQEKAEVPKFLRSLAEEVEVDLVLGNHDGGLSNLAPSGTVIREASGYLLDGVGYFHGHTWPDSELLKSEVLVAGHLHPTLMLVDPLGHSTSEKAWARGPLSSDTIKSRYGHDGPAPEMVVVPAFNPLCGGLPLNAVHQEEEGRGPILKMLDLQDTRAYLLDGTDIGRLGSVNKVKVGSRVGTRGPRKGYIGSRPKGQTRFKSPRGQER
jgi:uncharacterized protein